MSSKTAPQIVVIGGATSSGKSAVSMEICKLLNAEIIISDSVQVYSGLYIGSNKPTPEDKLTIPHHLVDVAPTSQPLNTGVFCEMAMGAIKDIVSRGKVPVVVGGSTMWMQWLVHGIPDAPKASTTTVQEVNDLINHLEIDQQWEEALDILRQRNAGLASKLSTNDWYRLRRYLEVSIDVEKDNKDISSISYVEQGASDAGSTAATDGKRVKLLQDYDVRCFFLMESRAALYHTIDDRCYQMLQRKLLDEVANLLLDETLKPEYTVSRAIGYRQTIEYLLNPSIEDNDLKSFKDYLVEFATATRNYARKQHNWYRRDHEFLFLTMNRTVSVSEYAAPALNPYKNIAQEIMHWIGLPREEFDFTRERQLEKSELISNLLKRKKLFIEDAPVNSLERDVIFDLLSRGLLKLSSRTAKGQSSSAELQQQWVQKYASDLINPSESILSPWTAEHPLIRIGEDIDGGKFMRTYMSKLETLPDESIIDLVRRGDELRRLLRSKLPSSLFEAFMAKF